MDTRLILLVAIVAAAYRSALAQAPSVEPTVVPTQTPLPPKELNNQTFLLYNDGSSTEYCLRMSVAISINVTYINSTGHNVTKPVALTDGAAVGDRSHCNSSAYVAELYVEMDTEELADVMVDGAPLYMVFEFKGDSTKKQWSFGNITLHVQPSFLDNYNSSQAEYLEFKTSGKLHQDANANIGASRSYVCSANQTLIFNATSFVQPFVGINRLQVQAFSFKNSTSGAFDSARTCLLDNGKANKIVPIAVGAALAGLVVVVLIAYLIGRLRSRRQSSYEALS